VLEVGCLVAFACSRVQEVECLHLTLTELTGKSSLPTALFKTLKGSLSAFS
jgi:hypothetical protein